MTEINTTERPITNNSVSIASKLFVDASITYAASVPHQAVSIALGCKESNLSPRQLKKALLADDKKIAQLAIVANNLHANSDNPSRMPQVNSSLIKSAVDEDFRIAEMVMVIPKEELEKFLTTFKPGEMHANIDAQFELKRLSAKYKRREKLAVFNRRLKSAKP